MLVYPEVATSMVRMMMCDQNGFERQRMRLHKGVQGGWIARVNSNRVMVVMHYPDVIILEHGQGGYGQHCRTMR